MSKRRATNQITAMAMTPVPSKRSRKRASTSDVVRYVSAPRCCWFQFPSQMYWCAATGASPVGAEPGPPRAAKAPNSVNNGVGEPSWRMPRTSASRGQRAEDPSIPENNGDDAE